MADEIDVSGWGVDNEPDVSGWGSVASPQEEERARKQVRGGLESMGIKPSKTGNVITDAKVAERESVTARSGGKNEGATNERAKERDRRRNEEADIAAVRAREDAEEAARKASGVSKYRSFGSMLLAGLDDVDMLAASAQEAVGEYFGSDKIAEAGREGRVANTREAEAYGKMGEFQDIRTVGDAFAWAGQTGGRMIPVMIPAMVGGALGAAAAPAAGLTATVGGVAGAFAPSLMMGVGEVQSGMKEKDPNAKADEWVFVGGTAIAALDSVLPGAVGGKLIKAFGREAAEEIAMRTLIRPASMTALATVTKQVAKEGGKNMVIEGLTESVQEAIGEVTAAKAAKQEINWDALPSQMIESAAAGALMGAGSGVATGAVQGRADVNAQNRSYESSVLGDAMANMDPNGYDPTRQPGGGLQRQAPLTDEDRASPIPDSLIQRGKTRMAEIMAKLDGEADTAASPLDPLAEPDVSGWAPEAPATTATLRQTVAPGARDRFMGRVGGVESGNKSNAKNPNSSASGTFQFTQGTWEALGGDWAKRFDDGEQARLMRKLTDQNEAALKKAGVALTEGNYYLAHFAGSGGAVALHRQPDAPVEQILGAKAVAANPFLKGMTGKDVIAWAQKKMGGTGGTVGAPGSVSETDLLAQELIAGIGQNSESAEGMLKRVLGEDIFEPKKAERVEVTQNGETVPGVVEDVWEQDGRKGVRVKLENGTYFDEALDDAKEYGARITRPAEVAPDLAGKPIDKEWMAFAPDSGSLGIPRAEMPQIKAEHRGAMVQFLKARGIPHNEVEVDATSLKPTQQEFSPGKVKKAREYEGGNRAILISSDNHVVDGHHQWLAARDAGEPIRAIQLDAPIRDVLSAVKEMPSATVSEEAPGAKQDQETRTGLVTPSESASTVKITATESGKGITVSGATEAQLAAIAKAVPKAKGTPGKSGVLYSKKYEAEIRKAILGNDKPQAENKADDAPLPVKEPRKLTDEEFRAATAHEPTQRLGRHLDGMTLADLESVGRRLNQFRKEGESSTAFAYRIAESNPAEKLNDAIGKTQNAAKGETDILGGSKSPRTNAEPTVQPDLLGGPDVSADQMTARTIAPQVVADVEAQEIDAADLEEAQDYVRRAETPGDYEESLRNFSSAIGRKVSSREEALAIADEIDRLRFPKDASRASKKGEGLPSPWQETENGEAPSAQDTSSTATAKLEQSSKTPTPAKTKAEALKDRVAANAAKGVTGKKLRDWRGIEVPDYSEQGLRGDYDGGPTKDAFLADGKAYLKAVGDILRLDGFQGRPETKGKKKGQPTNGLSVNPGGTAVAGDVYLEVYPAGEGRGIQLQYGMSALTGPKGAASLIARPMTRRDGRFIQGDNNWWPVDLTAEELAERVKKLIGFDAEAQPAAPAPTPANKSTAPEHAAVGVDDRELAEIVAEFNQAQASTVSDGEKITHIFDKPKPSEVVRLNDKVKVYTAKNGWMTPAEAAAKIKEWKANAAAQGKTRANADKVVLSLFDLTGKWSQPWEDAGYQVYRFDIQADPDMGDINNFSTEFFSDWFGDFDGMDIHAILAACPCTDFASSGSRHFAAKDADGRTVASVKLVQQTLATIEHFKPAVWAIENPVGRIEKLGGLPPWRLSFDPNAMGETYTKKTLLWGRFNADLDIAPVDPVEGSKMWSQYGGKSLATKNARSATPEGFAYSFFAANNAVDHPVMALANKFDRLDRGLIELALTNGVTEGEITTAVEDFYYQELDDDAANNAIRDLMRQPVQSQAAPTLQAAEQSRLDELRADNANGNLAEEDAAEFMDLAAKAKKPEPAAAPSKYAKNTIVSEDKIAAARARMAARMNQLNSGFDPEMALDGMIIAAGEIEAGVRNFAEFAKNMRDAFGKNITPYLLSFWESARAYPGLPSEGMTDATTSKAMHEMMLAGLDQTGAVTGETNAGNLPAEETTNAGPAETQGTGNDDRTGDEGSSASDALTTEQPAGGATGKPRSARGGGRGNVSRPDSAGADGNQPGNAGDAVAGDGGRDAGSTQPSGASGNSAGRRVRAKPADRGTDYSAPTGSLKRKGSWKATAERNLDVVELVNKLDAEKRPATAQEQELLASFTGWGAGEIRNNLFRNIGRNSDGSRYINASSWGDWSELQKRAATLLTGDALETALQSTQYAHYTSEEIIRSIWTGVQRLGFTGGRVLEPGMGNGLFAVAAPKETMGASHYTGIELDAFTAKVAQYLLPQETIQQGDYTKVKLPDGFYDLAIGNPPFADLKVLSDPAYKKLRLSLHDYFFAKTIDKVRPGGLMVFVTSRYTMDKLNPKARQYLADRADLLGAIRLPQTAFKENAGTEVVTDVLIFQRRAAGQEPGGQAWTGVAEVSTKNARGDTIKHMVNEYYVANPKMVLGVHASTGSMYRADEYTVTPLDGPIEAAFAKAIGAFPENVYLEAPKAAKAAANAKTFERDFAPAASKEGGLYVKDGVPHVVESGSGVPLESIAKVSPADKAWLADYVTVRDALKQAQKDQLTEGPWEKSLAALNKAYAAFTKKNGPFLAFTTYDRNTTAEVTDPVTGETTTETTTTSYRRYKWQKLLDHDIEGVLVGALEKITDDGEIVQGAFLKGRTLNKPKRPTIENAQDALAVTLDEIGRVDIDYAANLIGKDRQDIIEALGEDLWETPTGDWQTRDEYLSGNVLDKLEEAQAAADIDPKYERNVQALIAVQPKPLSYADITVKLGAGWVPVNVVETFAEEVLGFNVTITYDPSKAAWEVDGAKARYNRGNANEYGTDRRSPLELLDSVLNNRTVKITEKDSDGKQYTNAVATEAAQEAAKKIQDKFKSWVWTDSARAQSLSEIYNRSFNNIAPRTFNGDHLTFPGLTTRYQLRPHQKRAVWRQIQTGNTYLAHAVGAGKTLEMIVGGMEQRRLGLIQKPMYVVPNHMLKQFSQEFLEAYPAANIMVADEKQFHTDNRKRFMAQVALNDVDAIIVTHSSFKKIDTGEEARSLVVADMIAELEEAMEGLQGDNAARTTRSKIEKQIEKLQQKFAGATDGTGKDKAVIFEELGVDFLYIDEAHEFRKLDFATNRSGKGITAAGSQMSMDLFIKSRFLESRKPRRSMVMASGTPVTNTMAELYTVMRMMDFDRLEADGLAHFDAWANQFGEMSSSLEKNAVGNYEMVERFARFVNVSDLMRRVRTFMDVLTNESLGDLVKRPAIKDRKPINIVTPPVEQLLAYMKGPLNDRLEKSKAWKPSKDQPSNPDPIIAINGDALLSSIDMRFIQPSLKSDPKSKLNVMIDGIIASQRKYESLEYVDPATGKKDVRKGGAQIVFSPVGFGEQVAKSRGFSARDWIDQRLIESGLFKKSEIGWMSDANTHAKKEQLQKEVRNGRVKILLGSPKNMGTGLNVQQRLKVLHFLSPPWYPSDVEQPHGRIERQGNLNEEVEIYWYATEETYEASAWGMVARKATFIQQALSGDDSVRVIDDISAVSQYEMAAALAAGDDRAIRIAELGKNIEKFQRLKAAHADNQRSLASDKRWMEKRIPQTEESIANLEKVIKEKGPYAPYSVEVAGKRYDRPGEGGQALLDVITPLVNDNIVVPTTEVGKYQGKFPIIISASRFSTEAVKTIDITVKVGGMEFESAPIEMSDKVDPVGFSRRISNVVEGISSILSGERAKLAEDQQLLAATNKRLGAPFEDEANLADAVAERAQIEAQLAAEGKAKDAARVAAKAAPAEPAPKASETAQPVELSESDVPAIQAALQEQLESYGIADRISINAAKGVTLNSQKAAGQYWKRVIFVALEKSKDPSNVLAHETVHAMRDLGLFTDAEWRSLTNAAWENPTLRRWVERNYPADTYAAQREEAAAEHFADAFSAMRTDGKALWERALIRILRFLPALANAINKVRGKANSNALEAALIQRKILSGEIGQRAEAVGETPRRAKFQAFSESATEERWQDARKGIGDGPGVAEKARAWWEDVKIGFTRHWRDLPNEPRFADVGQQFRKLEAAPEAAMEQSVRYLRDLVGKMSKDEYDLFSRKVVLDDLSWEAGEKHDLPFGFTPKTLLNARRDIDALVAANPALTDAVRKRKVHNKRIADAMVAAGVLTREQIKNPAYFRHMVLDYARHEGRMARGAGSKIKSPYWAKRMGSTLDINANLLEAELDWLQKAQIDTATANTIEWIRESNHNIREKLRAEARSSNKAILSQMTAGDPTIGKQEAKFRSMIALGFARVKEELDSGAVGRIPPHLRQAALDIQNEVKDGEMPYALLAWILDNNLPGSMGAGMVLKYGGLRKAWLRQTLDKAYLDPDDVGELVKRLKPEGYKTWQPVEGRHLFTAKTITESALDMFVGKLAETTYPGVDREELHKALSTIRPQLVVGGDRYTMVLPEEIADTLTEFGDRRVEGMVSEVFSGAQAAWKRWVLINPRRFLKYNINNLSGDLDAIIAGNPGTLKQLRRAWNELRAGVKGTPSQRYVEAVERGVFTSGLSVQEIPDINRLSEMRHLTEDKGNLNRFTIGAVSNVWQALQGSTQFRENLFRLAAYLDYVEKIERGEPMLSVGYGASVPGMVDAVTDPRDKAALLARDLVGDYGSISVAGSWLRRYLVPFWSWTEINTRRYWRLTGNAYSQSKAKGLATGGLLGLGIAVRSAAGLAIRMGMVYGLLYMWNSLLFGDEEDDLGDQQKRQLHLILGRNDAGEVITLRTQGAFSDVFSMLGFPDAMAGLKAYQNGQGTLGQAIKDTLKAPVNRVGTSITPMFSVPFEQALDRELWPDMFNSREIKDNWRHLFQTFSLENEYDQAAGRPTRGYARSWEESLVYRRDPGEMAFDSAKGVAYDWLKNVKGQDGGAQSSPRGDALRDYRMAIKFGDAEAADEALVRYGEFGGTDKDLANSIKRQHPLGPIAKKDREAFLDSLTPEQLEMFGEAERWYQETYLNQPTE